MKVGVRKIRRASSTEVTPNRIKSPGLLPDIPEVCGFTFVIPLPERDIVLDVRP